MSNKTVVVLKGDTYISVVKMFKDAGWNAVVWSGDFPPNTNLVCFTGGVDVHPIFYREKMNGAQFCDPSRDLFEIGIYYRALMIGLPMVGICRGGQLLNVLNGGKMIQDLDYYVSGIVKCTSFQPYNPDIEVSVDHHQGMVASIEADFSHLLFRCQDDVDYHYAIVYPQTKCFCFQPHPEWGHKETKNLFFEYLKEICDDEG